MSPTKPEAAAVQRVNWLLLILGLAALAWLVVRAERHERSQALAGRASRALELTDAVPLGPSLLVTLDVAALSTSAKQQLLHAGGEKLLGLRELCGFEPLLGVRQALLALPPSEPGQSADFALIADTTLAPEPVLRCAEAAIRKGGGTPARSKLGAFTSVRAVAKPLGEVAIRGDGLFVLSGGQYFRAVIDAASGARASDEAARLRSALHATVRRKLAGNQLLVSALPEASVSLPGVKMLGLGLSFERDVPELHGLLYCASAADCQRAHDWLARMLAAGAEAPELAPLANLKVIAREAELEVTGPLTLQQLGNLATLLAP